MIRTSVRRAVAVQELCGSIVFLESDTKNGLFIYQHTSKLVMKALWIHIAKGRLCNEQTLDTEATRAILSAPH